jgi:hypothetical protein
MTANMGSSAATNGHDPNTDLPLQEEVRQIVKGKVVNVKPDDFLGTLGQIARGSNLKIAAFPFRTWVPREFKGNVEDVLILIARSVDGSWGTAGSALYLAPPTYYVPDTNTEKEKSEPSRTTSPRGLLCESFTPNQLRELEKGETLAVTDFSADQQRLVKKTFFTTSEKEVSASRLGVRLKVFPQLWRRGFEIGLEFHPATKWAEDPFWKLADKLARRGTNELMKKATHFSGGNTTEVDAICQVPVPSLETRFEQSDSKGLSVSAQLATESVIISQGKWRVDELLTAVAGARYLELRHFKDDAGELLFLAPTKVTAWPQQLRNMFLDLDRGWHTHSRRVKALGRNPRNQLGSFRVEDLVTLRLLPWPSLTAEQKQSLLDHLVFVVPEKGIVYGDERKSYLEARKAELDNNGGDIECFLYADIRLELYVPGRSTPLESGVGVWYDHLWLASRTRSLLHQGSNP